MYPKGGAMFTRFTDVPPTLAGYRRVLEGAYAPRDWSGLPFVDLASLPQSFVFGAGDTNQQLAHYGIMLALSQREPRTLVGVQADAGVNVAYFLQIGTFGSPESNNYGGTIRAICTPTGGARRVVGFFGMTLRRTEEVDVFDQPLTEPIVAFRLMMPEDRSSLAQEVLGAWNTLRQHWAGVPDVD